MGVVAAQTFFTPEEYIVRERKAEIKSEYLNGRIVAMSGASRAHNLITRNISGELKATKEAIDAYRISRRFKKICL